MDDFIAIVADFVAVVTISPETEILPFNVEIFKEGNIIQNSSGKTRRAAQVVAEQLIRTHFNKIPVK